MTTTNVTIDNLIDYSSQLNNLSSIATDLSSIATYLSNLPTISTSLGTIATSMSNIESDIDSIKTSLSNLIISVDSISTSTLALKDPISRISTATEVISTTSMKIATTASLSYTYTENKDSNDSYFTYPNYTVTPEVESAGYWIGKTTNVNLVTSTNNSSILVGYRVEGNNIDLDTFVSNINTSTNILTLNKSTLGSSRGKNKLAFFAS